MQQNDNEKLSTLTSFFIALQEEEKNSSKALLEGCLTAAARVEEEHNARRLLKGLEQAAAQVERKYPKNHVISLTTRMFAAPTTPSTPPDIAEPTNYTPSSRL